MVVAGVFIRIPSLYTESIINTISELVFPPISDATPQPSTSADAEKVDQDFIEDVSHAPSADCIVDVEVFDVILQYFEKFCVVIPIKIAIITGIPVVWQLLGGSPGGQTPLICSFLTKKSRKKHWKSAENKYELRY